MVALQTLFDLATNAPLGLTDKAACYQYGAPGLSDADASPVQLVRSPSGRLVSRPLSDADSPLDRFDPSRLETRLVAAHQAGSDREACEPKPCDHEPESEGEELSNRQMRKCSRPTKKGREAYRSFVRAAEVALRQDPAGFDADSLAVPQALNSDAAMREMLASKARQRLRKLQAELLGPPQGA